MDIAHKFSKLDPLKKKEKIKENLKKLDHEV